MEISCITYISWKRLHFGKFKSICKNLLVSKVSLLSSKTITINYLEIYINSYIYHSYVPVEEGAKLSTWSKSKRSAQNSSKVEAGPA